MPRNLTEEEQQRLDSVLQDDFGLYNALVMQPNDASAAVHGFAVIEALLQRLLERNVARKKVVRWHDLAITRRLELARGFGEIRDNVAVAIQKFAEIRNGLAHNPGFSLLESDVAPFEKAMGKAFPTEMATVLAKAAKGDLLLTMYGRHGRILRMAAFLLATDLRIILEGIPLDSIALIEAIEAYWNRPTESTRYFKINSAFDIKGGRIAAKPQVVRKDTPQTSDPEAEKQSDD